MFRYFCILCACGISYVYGQSTILYDSIPIYEIANNNFHNILDSFIIEESRYEYYNPNVTFRLYIMDRNGCVLQLSSGIDYKNHPPVFEISDIDSTSGIFYYKTHKFIMYGRYIISSKILHRTNNYIIIKKYNIQIYEDANEDDSFFPTIWIIAFKNDKFIITNKFPMEDYRGNVSD